jgi:hypothetical protein
MTGFIILFSTPALILIGIVIDDALSRWEGRLAKKLLEKKVSKQLPKATVVTRTKK